SDNPRAIGKHQRKLVVAIASGPNAETAQHLFGGAQPDAALPLARTGHYDQTPGFGERPKDGFCRRYGRFAELARAVENPPLRRGAKDSALDFIRFEIKARARE